MTNHEYAVEANFQGTSMVLGAKRSTSKSSKSTKSTSASTGASGVKKAKYSRLPAKLREDLILDEAVKYFAEFGPDAGTSGLASRLGMTQPLVYRYFSSKEHLFDQAYKSLWNNIHNPEWEVMLTDYNTDIEECLTKFYLDYSNVVLNYSAMRLSLFVRLYRKSPGGLFYARLRDIIFPLIVKLLRRNFAASAARGPITDDEMELVETLHGSIVHLAQRRWVDEQVHPRESDTEHLIRLKVRLFLSGARTMLPQLRSPG